MVGVDLGRRHTPGFGADVRQRPVLSGVRRRELFRGRIAAARRHRSCGVAAVADIRGARLDVHAVLSPADLRAHAPRAARGERRSRRRTGHVADGTAAGRDLPARLPRHLLECHQRRQGGDCGRCAGAYSARRRTDARRAPRRLSLATTGRAPLEFPFSYAFVVIAVVVVIMIAKTATVVPQQSAYIIEYLGKYSRTLQAGFHILIPFFEKIAYRHSLKEIAIDIAEQICITRDNVQVGVDAVLYMQVLDPHLASYGITNYNFAISQLAQTTLRSEIGKIELDRTFEARGIINTNVVSELDKASVAWGVKVLRYEIKNITPPKDVLSAMEKQMRAEREKRAVVLTSEGERDAKINAAEGDKQRVIKQSEANKQQQINEAEGQAAAILAVATATAEGLRQVGIALSDRGGIEAMQLRIGEEYVKQFGKLAQAGTTLVVPANLTDLASIVTMATSIARKVPATPAG